MLKLKSSLTVRCVPCWKYKDGRVAEGWAGRQPTGSVMERGPERRGPEGVVKVQNPMES